MSASLMASRTPSSVLLRRSMLRVAAERSGLTLNSSTLCGAPSSDVTRSVPKRMVSLPSPSVSVGLSNRPEASDCAVARPATLTLKSPGAAAAPAFTDSASVSLLCAERCLKVLGSARVSMLERSRLSAPCRVLNAESWPVRRVSLCSRRFSAGARWACTSRLTSALTSSPEPMPVAPTISASPLRLRDRYAYPVRAPCSGAA